MSRECDEGWFAAEVWPVRLPRGSLSVAAIALVQEEEDGEGEKVRRRE